MNKTRIILAVYQILGALIGVWVVIGSDIEFNMIVLLALTFFILGILAGVLLLVYKKIGYYMSLVYQGLQVPIIFSSLVIFQVISGGEFSISFGITSLQVGMNFYLGSFINIFLNPSGVGGGIVGINIIPVIILFVLLKNKKSLLNS